MSGSEWDAGEAEGADGQFGAQEASRQFGAQEEAEEQLAGFRSSSRGATARFAPAQAAIIRSLVGQIAELVGGDLAGGDLAGGELAGGELAGGDLAGGDLAGGDVAGGELAGGAGPDPLDSSPAGLAALFSLSDSTELPDDPVLARLLPDAYQDDPEASGEFRRYTEQDLRSGKVAAARTVLATLPPSGGRVRLTEPEGQAWLRALNDVRLALGVRLGVTDDFDDEVGELSADDPRSAYVWVYQWLAYLQDSLVEALS